MNNFELYAEKLRAVSAALIKQINSPKVFAGGYIAQPDEMIIYDENEAIAYATDQEIDVNKGPEYNYWVGLQEDNDRGGGFDEIKQLQLGDEFTYLNDELCRNIVEAIKRKGKSEKTPSPLIDWACADFCGFLIQMTMFDEQSAFHQKLYHAYENGGIPCGWKGEFPDGCLLVYSKN